MTDTPAGLIRANYVRYASGRVVIQHVKTKPIDEAILKHAVEVYYNLLPPETTISLPDFAVLIESNYDATVPQVREVVATLCRFEPLYFESDPVQGAKESSRIIDELIDRLGGTRQ